jgi:ATP-binding cassette subfamily B protein
VSLEIPARSAVAIVGAVGAGKTTLASLLPRLHEPPRGAIFLDGVDVRDLALSPLRKRIGFVPQQSFLFSDTVRENLAFRDPVAIPFDAVERSARAARLAADIERMPRRYEEVIGERGVNLSGGQRQRATIARAIAEHPEILILDDCLSSVDAETEHEILEELQPLLHRSTTIWITHRILSTRAFDRIFVLDEGRIVEQGTFKELLRADGRFARLARSQQLEGRLGIAEEAR